MEATGFGYRPGNGAAPDTFMTNDAITIDVTVWGRAVSDEEYTNIALDGIIPGWKRRGRARRTTEYFSQPSQPFEREEVGNGRIKQGSTVPRP